MTSRCNEIQSYRQMPRIRVKNTKGEYKCAARFFNPDKFEKEEEPTHLKFKRR
jgi:hypothetical protein